MKLPVGSRHLLDQLVDTYDTLAKGTDHQRRALNQFVCEQFRYAFGPGWGNKSGHAALEPRSKDALCYRDAHDVVWFVDWQNGSTRKPQVSDGQPMMRLEGQYFIPVDPVNHLGVILPPVQPELPTSAPPGSLLIDLVNELRALSTRIDDLDRQVDRLRTAAEGDAAALRSMLESISAQLATVAARATVNSFPIYEGTGAIPITASRSLPLTVRLTPQPPPF